MKKLSDEQIQKMLEEQFDFDASPTGDHEKQADLKAYQLLFEALDHTPHYQLPDNFADQVALQATRKQESNEVFRQVMILAACIAGGIIISIGAMYWLDMAFLKNLMLLMGKIKWLLLFCLIILVFVQTCDWFLIIKKRFQRQ